MSDSLKRLYPMLLNFVRKEAISKHLLRVTVTGRDLQGFPEDQSGTHIKVFFPNRDNGVLELPYREGDTLFWTANKPVVRAYTARKYHADVNELDIDFVIHGEDSPGGGWAIKAKVGSQIGLVGPAGPTPLIEPADWYIIAGDLTAVPAISAILEDFPSDSQGYVFIEIDDIEDKHDIKHPQGIVLKWLLRQSNSDQYLLSNAITCLVAPCGAKSLSAFIAGENESVIACRKMLKERHQLSRKNMYAIPYWKRGKDEEAYHEERHVVMDEVY